MAQEKASFPTSSLHGETDDVLEGCAASPDFLTPMQSLPSCSAHSGAGAAETSAAAGASSSPFFSERIRSLGVRRNEFASESEFEIEASKSHWTETSAATSDFDDENQRVSDSSAFEKLKDHPEWGSFFRRRPYELEIVGKIAEGGQAEIFEALGTNEREFMKDGYKDRKKSLVVKVFKRGYFLQDLQRWWPAGLASVALPYRYFHRINTDGGNGYPTHVSYGLCLSVGAQLLDDGRFAFIFDRYWGDFRKLIDRRMLKRNGTPPFSIKETHMILSNIAQGMLVLHKYGLLHKDLKAANVLTLHEHSGTYHEYAAYIADFESSVGTSGTGFWRAPEVLLALKNHSLKEETFTRQCDVYSYAMTCYEVLTGHEPFEGHSHNDYDIILRGERPPLPDDIYPAFKDLVRKCWHEDPLQRPSFQEIVADLLTTADEVEDMFGLSRNHQDYNVKGQYWITKQLFTS